MYLEHFGLKEPPFSITPDPRFVFLSERHRDALAHLLFGIDKGGGGGFVQLTGEVGTGKTTLCRLLLEQLPEHTRVALVLNPRQSPIELLETICEELHLDIAGRRGSAKALVDALNTYLLDAYAQGLRVVLIIDEAQDLSSEALEQVRLLTNLETDTQKLLQILLLGQPELRSLLAREELRQLAQRITARFHLTPLDPAETERYLRHRYAVASGQHFPFTRRAIRRLHAHAGGVPRLVNVIAERALLAGYARDETKIDARLVDLAAKEALPPKLRPWRMPRPAWALLALLAVAAGVAAITLRRPVMPIAVAAKPADRQAPAPIAASKPASPTTPLLDADGLAQRLDASETATPAWRALLTEWQLPTGDEDVAVARQCALVLAPDVHCVRARGVLDTLVALGRPVLLHLRSGEHDGWGMLLGSDALRVRLRVGTETFDLPRILLQRVWTGDYAAVWRAPATSVPDGDARSFQATHGLSADGVIGPETQFALAADEPGPHLLRGLD